MIRKSTLQAGAGLREGRVAVTFELPATLLATEVAVVGEFNDWNPRTHRLAQDHDGAWRLSLELQRGRRYEFRYLVDGREWVNDWAADDYVPNRSGGFNSVLSL